MSLKKLGLALVVVLAFGAVVANSATALKAVETNGFWYKNGTKPTTGVANALAVTCSIGKHNGVSEFILESTVVEPTGCTTPATVTTTPLKGQLWMEGTGTGERRAVFFKFEPASGTTFAEVEIEGCSLADTYSVNGAMFGET